MNNATIVVPWDFSRHAHAALRFAYRKFAAGKLHVICIMEPPSLYDPRMNWSEESKAEAYKNCEDEFYRKVDFAKAAGLIFISRFGDPPTEIVRYADEVNADYLVISTHGRTGIKGLFMGSVAQKISHSAACPIILLPHEWFELNSQTEPGEQNAAD